MREAEANDSTASPEKKPGPRPIRRLVRVAAVGALVLVILLLIAILPDQLRTSPPPAPVLSEPVRAILQTADERRFGGDALNNVPSATSSNTQGNPGAMERGISTDKDTDMEELIRGLLPVRDVSSVSEDKREAARRLNESVGQALRDLIGVLEESPSMTFGSAYERYFAVWKNLPDWYRESTPLVQIGDFGGSMRLLALTDFIQRAGIQIAVDHRQYDMAGGLCIELGEWDRAAYYWRQGGWRGRVAVAGLSVYRLYKQMDDAMIQFWAKRYRNQ